MIAAAATQQSDGWQGFAVLIAILAFAAFMAWLNR